MKFVCVFKDPGGGVQAVAFDSESEATALDGLIDRCVAEVEVAPGSVNDGVIVWPLWLIREDMTAERIARVGSGTNYTQVDPAGDAVVTESTMRRAQMEARNDG